MIESHIHERNLCKNIIFLKVKISVFLELFELFISFVVKGNIRVKQNKNQVEYLILSLLSWVKISLYLCHFSVDRMII